MTASRLSSPSVVPNRLQAFGNDTSGSINLIFCGALFFLIAVLGGAVDMGNAYKLREQLMAAADSASLTAVVAGSPGMLAAAAMTTDGHVPVAETEAVSAFYGEVAGQVDHMQPGGLARVIKTGSSVASTVSFTVQMPTHFLGLFGMSFLTIDGHVTSVSGTPPFIDFYLLLDNSPSMGIAATPADAETMVANTPDQCAFACHEADKEGHDYYTLAHNLGVNTRIEVLRQATQKLMDTAAGTATVPNQFRMSIDTFNRTIHAISPLTANLTSAKADAAAIDLMEVPAQSWNNDRDTDFDHVLPQLAAKVPASGTGLTTADTQKVVFLVTDGVEDTVASNAPNVLGGASSFPGGDRLIQAFDASLCTSMKARGIKIAVIYTTFVPLPTNGFYTNYVQPWQDQINPKIKACASPGYFFEVSPSQGIDEAMTTLFHKAVAEARITS